LKALRDKPVCRGTIFLRCIKLDDLLTHLPIGERPGVRAVAPANWRTTLRHTVTHVLQDEKKKDPPKAPTPPPPSAMRMPACRHPATTGDPRRRENNKKLP